MQNKVIWTEGMFLQPHHFQQQDRYFEYSLHKNTHYLNSYAWGFKNIKINHELLQLGKIGIINAEGLFNDGTVFNVPHNDKAPPPLDIPENIEDTYVYLSISLDLSRYQKTYTDVFDVNSIENKNSEIQIGKLDLKLMLEQHDRNGYSYLAIAKIKEIRSGHQIILDNEFIPPCLDVMNCPPLSRFINEVHELLQHRVETLAFRLTNTQQTETAEITDILLLQLVNRYVLYFEHLIKKQNLHPEMFYQICLQLLGEFSTFTRDVRRPEIKAVYYHDNLINTFKPIFEELKRSLTMVLTQNATAINLKECQHGIWMATIDNKDLLKNSNFILAVYAESAIEIIRKHFPIQAKIAPKEMIRDLVSRALPGIAIQSISVAPRQIPYHANFVYFILDKQHQYWNALAKSAGIAIHVNGDFPGLKLELWAVKG